MGGFFYAACGKFQVVVSPVHSFSLEACLKLAVIACPHAHILIAAKLLTKNER